MHPEPFRASMRHRLRFIVHCADSHSSSLAVMPEIFFFGARLLICLTRPTIILVRVRLSPAEHGCGCWYVSRQIHLSTSISCNPVNVGILLIRVIHSSQPPIIVGQNTTSRGPKRCVEALRCNLWGGLDNKPRVGPVRVDDSNTLRAGERDLRSRGRPSRLVGIWPQEGFARRI
jgi:hypothetical protein